MTSTCFNEPPRTDERIAGALLPDTGIFWQEDGVYLDLSSASVWLVECRAPWGQLMFAKSTGVTGAVGSKTVASATIAWLAGDLGLLTQGGDYLMELSATIGTKQRKLQFTMPIVAQVS